MNKKILIVSSFFENHVGYQEVQLAETLHSMGYSVKVIATDRSNLNLKKRYENSNDKFEIRRIKKLARIKNTFYPKENLELFFNEFNPDIVFLVLPGSGTPYFLLRYISKKAKVVSMFSDTTITDRVHKTEGIKGSKIMFNILKSAWYNKIFERSDLILANTNETFQILKTVSKKDIDKKIKIYGLGFNPNDYFFDGNLKEKIRYKLGIEEDQKLIVTISRIYKGKPFEFWVKQIKDFLIENKNFVYLLAGFDDTEHSKTVESSLKKLGLNGNLITHKFTSPVETNEIFNAADFSLWFAPTISIQQSMATGLFAIMPFDSTLDHLMEKNSAGFYYNNFDELKNYLPELKGVSYERKKNFEINQKFSYRNILQKVISELN